MDPGTLTQTGLRVLSSGDGRATSCIVWSAWVLLALTAAVTRAETKEVPANPGAVLAADEIVRLEIDPPEVVLQSRFDYRQLIVTGVLATGERVDLTRAAQVAMTDPLIHVTPRGFVTARRNGDTTVTVAAGGRTADIPVRVAGLGGKSQPDFVQDVAPVLSRLSCNAGTCHGSKHGKNGFKLSLRGYDPQFDHRALTDDIAARRFNRAAPDQSLMLLKPTGAVPHEGGVLLKQDEASYELLRQWIAAGARMKVDSPRAAKIAVIPATTVIQRPGMSQQMRVVATYADGTTRDVTREAFIEPSDIDVLDAQGQGLVTALRRGEAAVLVRYEGTYAAAPIVVMGDRGGYRWSAVPAYNDIDELVYDKLQKVKVLPSALCTDAEFIRRVYLDLTGLPPTSDEVRAFLADSRESRTKRDELIDRLVGSSEFVEHWTNKWADLLQVNAKFLGREGAGALRKWIRGHVASNTPYDRFVFAVLTASGSTMQNPAAAYYKILRTPEEAMENSTQLFLGIRFNCNKCHDHPFERWTQDQYYHLASYFAQVTRTTDEKYSDKTIGGTAVMKKIPLVEMISDGSQGDAVHERTGQSAAPQFPYEHDDVPPTEGSRRQQLARWMCSPKNPYFASSYVNRVWGYLLGVGLIEPVDDIRAGNPPTNPELLEALTQRFIADGFDVRQLITSICKSRTYQLSVATNRWNEDDTINYSHAVARRLPAEVLYDTIHQVTGSVSSLPGLPEGSRAVEMIDPRDSLPDGFLNLFGRPPRESACECERGRGLTLGPVMNLIMGPTLNSAISDPGNRIASLVAGEPNDARVVSELFLSILNRPATEAEIAIGAAAMRVDVNQSQLQALRNELAAMEQQLNQRQERWEKTLAPPVWQVLRPTKMESEVGAEFSIAEDGSIRVSGPLGKDVYTLTVPVGMQRVTGFRLEVLSDPELPGGGPGRARGGNFVLNNFLVRSVDSGAEVGFRHAEADFGQQDYDIGLAIDGNEKTGWAIGSEEGKNHTAVFETAANLNARRLTIQLVQKYKDKKHLIGRFRVSATASSRPIRLNGPPQEIMEIGAIGHEHRSEKQSAEIRDFFRDMDQDYRELLAELSHFERLSSNPRLIGAQDLAWALMNTPAFLFNR